MSGYRVRVHRRARRELSSAPAWIRGRVAKLILDLATDPLHEDWDIGELHGEKGVFRIRIGEYRIVYRVDEVDRVVSIERVSPRGNAYAD